MNEVVPLDQLATEIRYYSQQASWSIIEVGKRLIEAKKQVAHGEWADWLKNNVSFTQQTANKFMKCAEQFSNYASIRNLNPTQMIALLALPEGDTEAFMEQKKAEGNPVEDMTIKTLRQEIKEWKNKAEDNEQKIAELKEQEVSYRETIRQQRDELESSDNEAWEKKLANKSARISELEHLLKLEKEKRKEVPEPLDYRENKRRIQELEKEVATYKAHEEGMTLHQKALIDEEVAKYKNTASEEIRKSRMMLDLISAINNLPKNMEIADYAESHIRQNTGAEARTKADIEKLIIDLKTIHDELDNYIHKERKLTVVK